MPHSSRAFLGVVSAFLLVTAWIPVPHAQAATSSWLLKGASVVPTSSTDFGSDQFKQSVRNFQSIGGNYINFVVPYYQSNRYSTDIGPGYNTPTDASLAAGIDYVHSLGMRAQISIYLEMYSGEWRAYIYPDDRNSWYRNYGNVLTKYASLAQAHNVELYELGAELIRMASAAENPDNTARWNTMIGAVRNLYSGKLIYSGNRTGPDWTSELPNIGFWGNLDYIGVSAYHPLGGDGSVSSLKSQWANIQSNEIGPLQARFGKPILFTEFGYRSVPGAHERPFDYWSGGSYDPQEQVRDYQALFEFWNDYGYMQGAELWSWSVDPNAGGDGNTDYTPQNKPAEQTIKQWWSGGSTPPPSSGTPTFSSTGSVSMSGQTANISASITNSSVAVNNAIVDIEIYKGDTKVFQKFFEGQNFTQGQTRSYTTQWTASGTGSYSLRIGVFSSGWTQVYAWNGNAATFTVSGGSTPPPTSGATNIWWPTDGSHVSGVQPFKAMLEGVSTADYQMFWQVDGGGLVPMPTNIQDYPHKEALVDLSGWKWNGGGPYTVNFVSKNNAGTVIGQKSIKIFIP